MSAADTFIIIVNWNGKSILQKCLTSIFTHAQNTLFKVVVVDNASSDGSIEMVNKDFPQVKLFVNDWNAGFSKANNRGIRYALENNAKKILLLNNDVEITASNWLAEFIKILDSDSKIGIVGCKLLYPDGTIQHAGGIVSLRVPFHRGEGDMDVGQYEKAESVDYVTGAALMIKSEVIVRIGLLDEGFSPLYFEDTDWCVRAKLYGYKIIYSPRPVLIHHCGSSSNRMGSEKKRFYAKRSFIRFVLLNYQLKDIVRRALLFDSLEIARCFVVRGQGKMPLVLRPDTYRRLFFIAQAWRANIRNLKNILPLRRQRFASGAKLVAS